VHQIKGWGRRRAVRRWPAASGPWSRNGSQTRPAGSFPTGSPGPKIEQLRADARKMEEVSRRTSLGRRLSGAARPSGPRCTCERGGTL